MRQVVPHHEGVVVGGCCQDWLLHASRQNVELLLVEGDCEVRNLAKVFILLLLNAHA